MRFIQLSDIHLRTDGPLYGLDTAARLDAVINAIAADEPAPDFFVVTGDLLDCGREADEASAGVLKEKLSRLPGPVFLLPGNHDDPALLSRVFSVRANEGKAPFARGVRLSGRLEGEDFIALLIDSSVPGESGGRVSADDVRRLRRASLEAAFSRRALVIFLHHPPFRSGYAAMDAAGLANAGEFLAALRAGTTLSGIEPGCAFEPVAAGVFCGHLHRPMTALVQGVPCWCAPAVAEPLDPRARGAEARGTGGAPGYLRAAVAPDAITAEMVAVESGHAEHQQSFPIPYLPLRARDEELLAGRINLQPPL